MNITSLSGLTNIGKLGSNTVAATDTSRNSTFEDMFQAAKNLINETESYTQAAEEMEIAYALGMTDSTADLLVAQQKANLALQYTVAVRNNIMDAYKEIMNMQF